MRPTGGMRDVGFDKRPRGEDEQRSHLHEHEDLLREGRELDAHGDDRGDAHDPQAADEGHPKGGVHHEVEAAVEVQELEHVERGDLDEIGDDDDRGEDGDEADGPADLRTERPGGPDELLPAVGVGLVHVVEGRRHQQHRDERHDDDEGGVQAHRRDDEPEGHRKTVGRRH